MNCLTYPKYCLIWGNWTEFNTSSLFMNFIQILPVGALITFFLPRIQCKTTHCKIFCVCLCSVPLIWSSSTLALSLSFMTLTLAESAGQWFCRIFLSLGLSVVCRLWIFGVTSQNYVLSLHIERHMMLISPITGKVTFDGLVEMITAKFSTVRFIFHFFCN